MTAQKRQLTKNPKVIAIIALVVGLGLLALQNQRTAQVRFLWLSGEMPAFLLLFLTTAGGFLLGILVAHLWMRRASRRRQQS